ncbi:MAG TPA: GNAT family N-acetyltransferase [Clostridiaceae bacterium]|nr:GNAT family N-acetyltransferase [Clostridiaceae bacterium]
MVESILKGEVMLATADDIPNWMKLVDVVKENFPGLQKESYLVTLRKNIARKTALCFKENGNIVGILLFSPNQNRLSCVAVHPDYRRLGIASKLIEKMLVLLQPNREITVTTFREGDEKGVAPRKLYKKFGFEEAELLTEFGYPVQRFVLRPDNLDCILGVKHSEVKLVPYSELYNLLFAHESKKIAEALGDNVFQIYHVGSTAIVGAIAKPLLDISVCVRDINAIDVHAMKTLGYECMGEYGIPGRCYFVKRKNEDISTHHVHCFTDGNENLTNQLLFREYLNTHPEAVREYNKLKLSLFEKYPKERHKYTECKTDFIMNIVQLAQKGR